jgi:ParB family transcriptional regulator, chromosome partitioning protein
MQVERRDYLNMMIEGKMLRTHASFLHQMPGFVEQLDIRKIHRSRRSLRSELHSVDELMASVLEVGLLEPIVVRPLTEERGFEVVAGNRRLEACKRLGMKKVPSHIVELDDREAYEASLIENLQHMTLDPIEEAEAFKRYVNDYGYGGVSELAKRIGKSAAYVSRRISLLKLPSNVQEELLRRRKTPSVAQELLSLNPEDRDRVAELIIQDKKETTQREVRSMIRRVKSVSGANHGYDEADFLESQFQYTIEEQRGNSLGRVLAKCIVALKLYMDRLDEIYEHVGEDEWVVKDMLMRHRWAIDREVNGLMNLRRKTIRSPPPLT